MEKLLGNPVRMFDGDNIYVISEMAEVGQTYGIVCPTCHNYFDVKVEREENYKVKCPECETLICFSSTHEGNAQSVADTNIHRTQVSLRSKMMKSAGLLKWTLDGKEQTKKLKKGTYIIGRQDPLEPSDISLSDTTASRRSVQIEVHKGARSGNYSFKLTVLKTTNAVFVNNNMLYANDCVYLNYGDILKVGDTALFFDKLD
jgi:hypothetical protein